MWCDALKNLVCKVFGRFGCASGFRHYVFSGGGLNAEGCHTIVHYGLYYHRGNSAPALSKTGSRPGSIERLGTPEPIIAYDRKSSYGYPTHVKSGFILATVTLTLTMSYR